MHEYVQMTKVFREYYFINMTKTRYNYFACERIKPRQIWTGHYSFRRHLCQNTNAHSTNTEH